MYGKHFTSMYTGSMLGAGADVYAVWGWAFSHTVGGVVELNPRLIAFEIGMTEPEVQTAINYLCEPDPQSRNPEAEGRRLIHEGSLTYRVVSHELYRDLKSEQERREGNRLRQQRRREKLTSGTSGSRVTERDSVTGRDVMRDRVTSVSVSASEEGGAEGESAAEAIPPEMVASAVLTECGISGRELRTVLEDVSRSELAAGRDPDELRDALIAAHRQYSDAKPRLAFPKGAVRFFGEGDWRNPAGWPWKDGQQPQTANMERFME